MNKIRISFLAVSLVLLMVFLPMLIPIAEARARVCDFCDGIYKGQRNGASKTINSQQKYENGAHYIRYQIEQIVYAICSKNRSGHRTTYHYWTSWELMGY